MSDGEANTYKTVQPHWWGWPCVPALVGVLLGVGLQIQQAVLGALWGYGLALVIGSLATWRLKVWSWQACVLPGLGRRWVLALLSAVLLGWGWAGTLAVRLDRQSLAPALAGQVLRVTGRVASMPQHQAGGLRFRFAVQQAWNGQGQAVVLPPQLWVGWWGGVAAGLEPGLPLAPQPPGVLAGETWTLSLRLKPAHGARNPGAYDHELWLWEQGLRATATVRQGLRDDPPQRVDPAGWRYPVEQLRQRVRDAIFARLSVPLGASNGLEAAEVAAAHRAAGVVAALVVGDQSSIDKPDWDLFRATGVAHLMSISGLHITLFAWLAVRGVGWLWRRSARLCRLWPSPWAGQLGGLVLALAYAVFSGWGVPAQRTVLMLVVVMACRAGLRLWPWPLVWLCAAVGVSLADPWALLQAGFWLSFVAVGVLFASDSIANYDHLTRAQAGFLSYFSQKALHFLREQWVITLALTPLSLWLFGQVSLVSLLANALAVPWVTLGVTPLALAGAVWPPLWDVAALAVRAQTTVLSQLAAWPWATLALPVPPLGVAIGAVLGGVWMLRPGPWRWRALGLPLVVPALWWPAARPAEGGFELWALDVGQGTAVVVRTARHTLVYDAGPRYSPESDAGQRVLLPWLRSRGEPLDRLVLSHQDSDHIGGAQALLLAYPQAAMLASLPPSHALWGQAQGPQQLCLAGQSWVWDGVSFEVLYPGSADLDPKLKPNARSCVLRVHSGPVSALLTGDIEAPQEAELLARWPAEQLASTVLLVPHHGSKTSSTPALLDVAQPRWALIQAGYLNRYGHPAAPVLARYAQRGIALRQSATCGAARWESTNPERMHCEREVAPRYWQHNGLQ